MAITTSRDKNFKIWQLVMQPGVGKNNVEVSEPAWACRSVGVYRDYVPHHAAFSEDGSILAVAYGQIVTLWDPYTNTFQGVLVHPPENRAVKRVEFLGGNSPFLVSLTQDHLYVWNLLTCKGMYKYHLVCFYSIFRKIYAIRVILKRTRIFLNSKIGFDILCFSHSHQSGGAIRLRLITSPLIPKTRISSSPTTCHSRHNAAFSYLTPVLPFPS